MKIFVLLEQSDGFETPDLRGIDLPTDVVDSIIINAGGVISVMADGKRGRVLTDEQLVKLVKGES